DAEALCLQRSQTSVRDKPDAPAGVVTIKNLDARRGISAVERAPGMIRHKLEETLPIRIAGIREKFFTDLLDAFIADRFDGRGDRLAAALRDAVHVEVLALHMSSKL